MKGPGGKQVSFHWSDPTCLLSRSTTCVSFRLSWLQAHLRQSGARIKDPPHILSSLGPGLRLGLEAGIPLNQQLLRRQLTSHQPNPKYRISVKLLCNLQPVAAPLWVIHITFSKFWLGSRSLKKQVKLIVALATKSSYIMEKKRSREGKIFFSFFKSAYWIIFTLL